MDDAETIRILTEMKEQLKANNGCLIDIKVILQSDRNMMWKLLMLVIGGAFALIGIKLVTP